MNKIFISAIGAVFAMSFSLPAFAIPTTTTFDFGGQPDGDLGTNTLTVNGVTATAYYWDDAVVGSESWDAANLYRRDQGFNDIGLGVCSPNESCLGGSGPNDGGGDVNELSNQLVYEVIRLDKGSYDTWDELWVSSLDSSEVGTLFWGNSSDIDTLLSGSMFTYDTSAFGSNVYGDILSLAVASGFDATAQYVLFTPGSTAQATGTDNDYLVWKGAVSSVPAPAVLGLMSIGLLGVGAATKRRNRKH